MTPQEFRSLLSKATARPWDNATSDDYIFASAADGHQPVVEVRGEGAGFDTRANGDAIVATMNRAELFGELWAAALDVSNTEGHYGFSNLRAVLAKLEAAP